MVNSNVILCVIIFILSLHKISFISAFSSTRNSHNYVNKTNDETISKKETILDSDEMSDEEADDTENDASSVEDNSEKNEYEDEKNCTCYNSSCTCCINLNLSFIDFGGPGCVKFNYISSNDSLSVNMSYGDRLLESSDIKRENSDAVCMDLFSDLAQICAKFSTLLKVSKGIKGCLTIEPLLLSVPQTRYDVGCFDMEKEGVQQPISHSVQAGIISTNITKETTDKVEENEEEELAAAISQSAEEGFAWFNNFISSVFGEELNETSTEPSTLETPSLHNKITKKT